MTIRTANLGFPRIGRHRGLKFALEAYWSGKADRASLLDVGKTLRAENWKLQQEKGIDGIPSNDFSFHDHVLDTAVMVGAIPPAYGWAVGPVDIDIYFAMARRATGGEHAACGHVHHAHGVPALKMSIWCAPQALKTIVEKAPETLRLSLGVIRWSQCLAGGPDLAGLAPCSGHCKPRSSKAD